MPRTYNSKTLIRVCIRLWADDYDFLDKLSRAQALGKNLLVRQIVHSYVVHVRDKEQQELNNLTDDDFPDIEIDLTNLEYEPVPEAPEPKGQVIDITL